MPSAFQHCHPGLCPLLHSVELIVGNANAEDLRLAVFLKPLDFILIGCVVRNADACFLGPIGNVEVGVEIEVFVHLRGLDRAGDYHPAADRSGTQVMRAVMLEEVGGIDRRIIQISLHLRPDGRRLPDAVVKA